MVIVTELCLEIHIYIYKYIFTFKVTLLQLQLQSHIYNGRFSVMMKLQL